MSTEGSERPNATPRFILTSGHTLILAVTGNAGWKDQMWPKLVELTETSA